MTELAARLRLSALAVQRWEALHREAAGLQALGDLAQVLDPDGRAGRWKTAGRIATLLERFSGTAWVRISRGGREPRGPAEAAMARILAAGLPLSQRRISDLIN